MKNNLILNPVDNTVMTANIEKTYSKGYSEYNRLFFPNQATDNAGNTYHYFQYGVISLDNKVSVEKSKIFLKNGYLQKPGIIVEKYYVKKKLGNILLGNEKYFLVIDSNVDAIPKHSLVIVMAGQGHRFNLNKREYFFVHPDKVLIIIGDKGIIAGPNNLMLEKFKKNVLGIDKLEEDKGTLGNKTYYFSDALYDIVIKNKKYVIVPKKNIKLVT